MVLLYMVTFTIDIHQYTPHVSIYTSTMDPSWERVPRMFFQWENERKNISLGHGVGHLEDVEIRGQRLCSPHGNHDAHY